MGTPPGRRLRRALPPWGGLQRRLEGRDDSGQALWLVIILVTFLALLAPLMVTRVTSDDPLLIASTDKHAALAAAEAGIQWYRDNLDSYAGYYTYTASNNPTNDAALSGWCGAGLASTCGLAGTNPQEAFHYVPDDSQLFSQTGGAAGTVVLTVTGRAGAPGNYAYVVAKSSFSATSVLDDAYFSNYEVLDPSSDTIQGTNVTSCPTASCTNPVSTPETQYEISYSYTNSADVVVPVNDVSVWTALCQYDTYSPNTFIDSLGVTLSGTAYSASHPYYGPYQLSTTFTFDLNAQGVVTAGGSTQVTVPSLACGDPYDFVSGENFSGPVYTNDQLHVCGSPTFNGSPVSLTSGAPSDVPYLWDVPGSVEVTAANSGNNGPYPSSLIGDYVPAGYTVDTVNCGGSDDDPSLAHGVALNGSQSLPSLNTSLAEYGTASPPSGTIGTGCTYTGPTMIELVTSGGSTTMDVWSPLSSSTGADPTTSACSGGGTFSATNPLITGIQLPSDGVIYVQNYTLGSTLPTVPSDGATPCFNPYRYNLAASDPECYEGDVYIGGELNAQLTVGSAANIMITRNLTYACADGSGGASSTDPSSVSACTSSATPDILGLSAKYDILVSHNDPSNSDASTASCSYDGTGTPPTTVTTLGGKQYANDPYGVWPWVCDPTNVIVDAAVLALNGSLGTENWDLSPYSDDVNLNGTDLSYYRGPFGISGTDGYEKNFSYDTRLNYVIPPHVLPNGIPVWQVGNYIVCPTAACTALP